MHEYRVLLLHMMLGILQYEYWAFLFTVAMPLGLFLSRGACVFEEEFSDWSSGFATRAVPMVGKALTGSKWPRQISDTGRFGPGTIHSTILIPNSFYGINSFLFLNAYFILTTNLQKS